MSLRSFSLTAFVVAGGLLALTLPAPSAQDKKTPGEAESGEADSAFELATTAYKAEEFGRANNSPEALVAAAVMLRSLKSVTKTAITEIPTDENGKAIEEKTLEDKSFQQQSDDLFKAASLMAGTLKIEGFNKYIKDAKDRELTRYLAGGAKSIKRRIGPGKTEVFHLKFRNAEPWCVAFNASHPLHLKAVRTDVRDHVDVWFEGMHRHFHHHSHAGGRP